ncbi:MAG: Fic family protein [Clostridia bacterium]|nr:Fic family protein [Clostridia bacterium]NLV33097.1 Fic family protein [Clostridiaceae bacterium]HPB16859.1 Fic family protein [Clostridia bacterium]HQO70152.1 Fic family protein [Clostridia bacterium]
MSYEELCRKRDYVNSNLSKLSPEQIGTLEKEFECDYTYESTKIKGNMLTRDQVKAILNNEAEDMEKNQDVLEIINHSKAFRYMKMFLKKNTYLDEEAVKEINAIVVEDISVGGIYRNVNLIIPGRKHVPPSPEKAYYKMKKYFNDLPYLTYAAATEKAMYAYAMFMKIHPFVDGNSRTGKLIMNYVLMKEGFLPIYIPKDRYKEYVHAFELFASEDQLEPLAKLAYEFEQTQLDRYIEKINLG